MAIEEARIETCTNCGAVIRTMAFKGTGVCGDICRKARDGDDPSPAPDRSTYAQDPPAVVTVNHQDPTAVRMHAEPGIGKKHSRKERKEMRRR